MIMQLHGHIHDEIAKWPDAEWPVMNLETARKLAEDIFRQYELCKGSDSCTLLMAIVDSAEGYFFSAAGRVGI